MITSKVGGKESMTPKKIAPSCGQCNAEKCRINAPELSLKKEDLIGWKEFMWIVLR
jgi:hypothetical protein